MRGGRSSIASLLASPFGRGHNGVSVSCFGFSLEKKFRVVVIEPVPLLLHEVRSASHSAIASLLASSDGRRVRGRSASRSEIASGLASAIASLLAPSFGSEHLVYLVYFLLFCYETVLFVLFYFFPTFLHVTEKACW